MVRGDQQCAPSEDVQNHQSMQAYELTLPHCNSRLAAMDLVVCTLSWPDWYHGQLLWEGVPLRLPATYVWSHYTCCVPCT